MQAHPPAPPVLIVGTGTIGLSIGWELARDGTPVRIFDRGEPGQGAACSSARPARRRDSRRT